MPIKCLLKGPFSALGQLQTTENPLQILKALFIPCDMNIFALTFCLCRKELDTEAEVTFKIYDATNWTNKIISFKFKDER